MWELWGVEILTFPLTWHIAYTTACCYRTGRDFLFPRHGQFSIEKRTFFLPLHSTPNLMR